MLQGENHLDDDMGDDTYSANLDETTNLKQLQSQHDLSKTDRPRQQHLNTNLSNLRQAQIASNVPKPSMKKGKA